MTAIPTLPAASDGQPLIDFVRASRTDRMADYSTLILPDEKREPNRLRWAAGAADGVGVHHLNPGDQSVEGHEVLQDVVAIAESRWPRKRAHALYRRLAEGAPVVGWADAFTEAIGHAGAPKGAVRDLGRWLVRTATDREPAKFGIVLCGLAGAGTDDEVLLLGGHEEFTLFAMEAVFLSTDDPDPVILDLAQRVHGWGRIHLVERLVGSPRQDIKEWLLRGGYHNTVMDEYVAHLVAERCGLREALAPIEIDEELLDGAGGLIVALLLGGPAQDIDDYDDGVAVVTRYLDHVRGSPLPLERVGVVAQMARWLASPDGEWEERITRGWTASVRAALGRVCSELLERPETIAVVDEGLRSADDATFCAADYVAALLGIDTFEQHMALLARDHLRSRSWYEVVRQVDDSRILQVVTLAEDTLGLATVATGPDDLLGVGPEFAVHGCVDFVLQGLGPFPGMGWTIVSAAIQSPVIRNRIGALGVLDAWGLSHFPVDALELLRRAHQLEPHETVRSMMRALLDDGYLPQSAFASSRDRGVEGAE